jgi:uncharacterized membrane protein HdeD (DUF308 family)
VVWAREAFGGSMASIDPLTGMTTDEERSIVAGIGKTWWVLLFVGIVSIVVGALLVFRPAGSTWVLAVLLAIYLIISGIFSLVRAFAPGLPGSYRALLIIGGAIGLLLGLLMFRFGPDEKIEILGIFVGVWFLFSGVASLFGAGEVQAGRGWAIFNGVVYLIAGIVLLVTPYAVEIFVWVAGIWLVVLGLFEIISSFQVKAAGDRAAKAGA